MRVLVSGVALLMALSACGRVEDARMTATVGPHWKSPSPRSVSDVFKTPPTIAQCQARLRMDCYTAAMLRRAYGVDKLNATGKGRTIAVFDFTGVPTAKQDLETFSRAMGLPAPQLEIRQQEAFRGQAAKFDPTNQGMLGTASETTLDLQAAHAVAPDAKLVLEQVNLPAEAHQIGPTPRLVPQPAQPQQQPMQQRMAAEMFTEIVADAVREVGEKTSADVVSISYGFKESRLGSQFVQDKLQHRLDDLTAKGVTVLASTGDSGAAQPDGPSDAKLVRSVAWPSISPTVVAVGGTRLHLDQAGRRTSPDTVWNDPPAMWRGGKGATGGGLSTIFGRPRYQDPVRDVVGDRRGAPDISMSADPDGGLLLYQSFAPVGQGWFLNGGTSEAAPLFAGVVTLAGQMANKRLGNINPTLYALAQRQQAGMGDVGIVDVTEGENGPDGYKATKGYDLASGWGTVNAAKFIPALAAFQ